jgi:hypothetical protein
MFGWQRRPKSMQSQSRSLGEVYSLASDYAYSRDPWGAHRITGVTATLLFVDFHGQLHSLDRAKLDRAGHVVSSGVCFYSKAAMRSISAASASLREASAPKPRTQQSGDDSDLLGLGPTYTRADVMASFRRRAFELHPDQGGDPVAFDRLVEARMRALARLRR